MKYTLLVIALVLSAGCKKRDSGPTTQTMKLPDDRVMTCLGKINVKQTVSV